MFKVVDYYQRFDGVRGRIGGLPPWARLLMSIAALPGVVLIALSVVALIVSILALLLLTVPLYRVLSLLTGATRPREASEGQPDLFGMAGDPVSPGRKKVDVTIIE